MIALVSQVCVQILIARPPTLQQRPVVFAIHVVFLRCHIYTRERSTSSTATATATATAPTYTLDPEKVTESDDVFVPVFLQRA